MGNYALNARTKSVKARASSVRAFASFFLMLHDYMLKYLYYVKDILLQTVQLKTQQAFDEAD